MLSRVHWVSFCSVLSKLFIYSLVLVPLKSASRASISSSEASAFSITLRPPDLLDGTKVVSFPRLQVLRKHNSVVQKSPLRLEEIFLKGAQNKHKQTQTNEMQVFRRKVNPDQSQGMVTFNQLEWGESRFSKAEITCFKKCLAWSFDDPQDPGLLWSFI